MRYIWIVIAIAFSVAGGLPQATLAQPADPTARPIDVVIVLDDSESMATSNQCGLSTKPPASDPNDLRYSAARLLVQLADSDDRIAVVRFDAKAQDVGELGMLQPVGGPSSRTRMIEQIKAPSSYSGRCYTRMDLGLRRASEILAASAASGRSQYILFLTDGYPTQPSGIAAQDATVRSIVTDLRRRQAEVLPVLLCTPSSGCSDRAETFISTAMGKTPVKARTAADLLQVFSSLFAQMKPNLHVVREKNRDGDVEFHTRTAHAARQINVVSDRGSLRVLRRDGSSVETQKVLEDSNIEVSVVESSALPSGRWTVESGPASFVVARTDTYPEVVHPPATSATALRFVPTGKPVLVVGAIVGPGGGEELYKDGTPLTALTADRRLRFVELPATDDTFTLQVGNDTVPLQIKREFGIEMRSGLPSAQAPTPECVPQARCRLEVGVSPGPEVRSLKAQVYVLDESDQNRPVYNNEMTCSGRQCVDTDFQPLDGHSYRILFTVQAVAGDILYGDWAETSVTMAPTVIVRGLPDPLDPTKQPDGGWSIRVIAGTTEDLGRLRARPNVKGPDGMVVDGVDAVFSADIRGAGEQQASLQITLPEDLRPGRYEGELVFYTDRQVAGVQLPPPHRIVFAVKMLKVEVLDTALDFGNQTFDPSPNFRVDLSRPLRLRFDDRPFSLRAELLPGATCENLAADIGKPEAIGDEASATVRLWSQQPLRPGVCSGYLRVVGPSNDYRVENGDRISWRFEISALEWRVMGVKKGRGDGIAPDLVFNDLGRAMERQKLTLLVTYTGRPPFALKAEPVDVKGRNTVLGKDDLEVLVGPPELVASGAITYEVPIELVAQKDIDHHFLLGTVYNGKIRFTVPGLPDTSPQEMSFRFRSPSWPQRHILSWFHFPWPGIGTISMIVLVFGALWIARARYITATAAVSAPETGQGDHSKPTPPASNPATEPPNIFGPMSSAGYGSDAAYFSGTSAHGSVPIPLGASGTGSEAYSSSYPWLSPALEVQRPAQGTIASSPEPHFTSNLEISDQALSRQWL